jgi:hypothetical protein
MSNNLRQIHSEPYIQGLAHSSNVAYEIHSSTAASSSQYPTTSSHIFVSSSNNTDRLNSAKRNTMYNFNFGSNAFASAPASNSNNKNPNSSVSNNNNSGSLNPPSSNSQDYLNMLHRLLNTYNIGSPGAAKLGGGSYRTTNISTFKSPEEEANKTRKPVRRNQSFNVHSSGSNAYYNTLTPSFNNHTAASTAIASEYASSPFATVSGFSYNPSNIAAAKNSLLLNGNLFTNNKPATAYSNNNSANHNSLNSNKVIFTSSPVNNNGSVYDPTYGLLSNLSTTTPQSPPIDLSIRFAVNGISKFAKATSATPSNRSIQAGLF